jgi:hypothetical protein
MTYEWTLLKPNDTDILCIYVKENGAVVKTLIPKKFLDDKRDVHSYKKEIRKLKDRLSVQNKVGKEEVLTILRKSSWNNWKPIQCIDAINEMFE